MKIIKDDKGKYIVDFEGLEIKVEGECDMAFVLNLFNPNAVSEINNGVWMPLATPVK